MTIGVLVLAAGRARRFGSDKRMAWLPTGKTVLEAQLDQVETSGLPVVVCLDERDVTLGQELVQRGTPVNYCRRAVEGMGGTLAEGVGRIPDWQGVLIALADMPWVAPSTYRAVARQLQPGCICIPTHGGERGHPVGFGARFYQELEQLGGDSGARNLLDKHRCDVVEVPVQDPAIHRDIDVPTDL